jgi:transglutaminase-like putative cysteine protease
VAVGVAHDGDGFVWHAWVEVRTAGRWVAVDPAFGQVPARGPRFTIARHAGDAAGLAEAGRRILACWGRARVE